MSGDTDVPIRRAILILLIASLFIATTTRGAVTSPPSYFTIDQATPAHVCTVAPVQYSNPLPGGVISQGLHANNAVDIRAGYGAGVVAAATGTVVVASQHQWNGGYGNYVVIDHHNNTTTLYAHLAAITATVGQTVDTGELIGTVGTSGQTTGPHLHFEVHGANNPFI